MKSKTTLSLALAIAGLSWNADAATLQMRLVASDYNEGTGAWTDSSGMGNDTLSRIGNPTLVGGATPSGADVVRFDGAGDGFNLADLSGFNGTGGEAFVVVRLENDFPTIVGAETGLWKLGTAGPAIHYPWSGDGNIYDDFGRSTRLNTGNPTADLTEFHIYNVRATATEWQSLINNSVHHNGGAGAVSFRSNPILGKDDGNFNLDGDIAEFRFYSETLTSVERDAVYNSLVNAYLIPEPSTFALLGLGGLALLRRQRK